MILIIRRGWNKGQVMDAPPSTTLYDITTSPEHSSSSNYANAMEVRL